MKKNSGPDTHHQMGVGGAVVLSFVYFLFKKERKEREGKKPPARKHLYIHLSKTESMALHTILGMAIIIITSPYYQRWSRQWQRLE